MNENAETATTPRENENEDVTDGLREFEDAAAEVDLDQAPSVLARQRFSKHININGTLVSKARALSQRFKYHKLSASTDRLRRVEDKGRYNTSLDDNYAIDEDEGPS